MVQPAERVLLTGATGYIGGRLLERLQARGGIVRCLVRQPQRLASHTSPTLEVAAGDLLDLESVVEAMRGVTVAYYLVHSMRSGSDFVDTDRRAARNFATVARQAGVQRIVYLGGLGDADDLSPHLASRQEVGRILRDSGVPTLELQASIIIGSGSLSFEMIRALVERLPVMTTPRWVRSLAQPIAVEDVLDYLIEALDVPLPVSHVVQIGGADRASYCDIMREYARQRGLRRLIVPVPVLTPRLSSLWLGIVTPIYARIGRELVEGVRNATVVTDDAALRMFRVRPRGLSAAIERALRNEDAAFARTRWCDALSVAGRAARRPDSTFGSRIVDSRSAFVKLDTAAAFAPIESIGGDRGWYFTNMLWRIRGLLDLLVGGPGLRRGRRHPTRLAVGETLDFWRVEALERGRLLRLRAEMRLPGRAWLQFEVEPAAGGSWIRQTALFDPQGVLGRAYWYALYPIHRWMFAGMLRALANPRSAARERRCDIPG